MADHSANTPVKTGVALSNASYDLLRRFVEIILPGVGSLYFGVAQIWGLPNADKVVGTVAVLTIFMALVLRASRSSFNAQEPQYDGEVIQDEDGVYRIQPSVEAEELISKKQLVFKGLDSA